MLASNASEPPLGKVGRVIPRVGFTHDLLVSIGKKPNRVGWHASVKGSMITKR